MPTKRSVAVFGARTVGGLIGVGVVAAVVGATMFVQWPVNATVPAGSTVTPVPSEQTRVCPGPLLTVAEDASQAQSATSVGAATIAVAAADAGAGASLFAPDTSELEAPDNTFAGEDGAPLLVRVPAEAETTVAPLVAGSQTQTARTETLGGFAAAACAEASSDSWLVGGSTDIGRTTLVLLANPTPVVATVSLSVYSETGLVDSPGSTGILVQPGSQRVVSLAGLAPNLKSPVVHVTSHGGQVVASLEQSVIRGIEPGGVDLLGVSGGPALTQSIPGLLITTPTVVTPGAEADELHDGGTTVRILVTGDKPATVQVGVVSGRGQGAGTSLQVQLQPGIATEVPLGDLAAGVYAVQLTSDQPIVAAATASTAGASGKDFTWFAAAAPLGDEFLVNAAAGPAPTLHLMNTGAFDETLTVTPESGAAVTVDLPAGQAQAVPLSSTGPVVVSGGSMTVASVGYLGDGQIASFAIQPAGPLAAPITVYLR